MVVCVCCSDVCNDTPIPLTFFAYRLLVGRCYRSLGLVSNCMYPFYKTKAVHELQELDFETI